MIPDLFSALKTPSVLIQGITGREASMVAKHMQDYGTKVVAGVSPGKGGQKLNNIPVYDSVAEALEEQSPNISVVYVPPAHVKDATLEAIESEIPLILIITERVPQKDTIQLIERARAKRSRIIGPNITGIIMPAKRAKIGPIGGDRPDRTFIPGDIAVISRSGGMTSEIAWMLKRKGYGTSISASIGGDPILGTTMKEMLEILSFDELTRAAVLFCEPGGSMETEVAQIVKEKKFPKPVIALVAGRFTEMLPRGVKFGHAGTLVQSDAGLPSSKIDMFRESGVHVADTLSDISIQISKLI